MPILRPAERIGTRLVGRYRFERILAYGGMGVLFAGFDTEAQRRVAIKLLKPDGCDEPGRKARFLRESETAARLRHPHIVDVFDAGEAADGTAYLVMALLDGESLEDELRRSGSLSPQRVLALLLPVMGAVASAHRVGIIHRDLKPSNIFLHRGVSGVDEPRLLDFGVAKSIEAGSMTTTGVVVGTPDYMSPEQACDGWVTPASDVWAFGVILYRCLTGELPFRAASTPRLLMQLAHTEPPRLTHRGDVPKRLAAAVDKALERDLGGRYRSVVELVHALVNTAIADGIQVPIDPDPKGLPELPAWVAQARSGNSTDRMACAPPPLRSGMRSLGFAALVSAMAVGLVGGTAWSTSGARLEPAAGARGSGTPRDRFTAVAFGPEPVPARRVDPARQARPAVRRRGHVRLESSRPTSGVASSHEGRPRGQTSARGSSGRARATRRAPRPTAPAHSERVRFNERETAEHGSAAMTAAPQERSRPTSVDAEPSPLDESHALPPVRAEW